MRMRNTAAIGALAFAATVAFAPTLVSAQAKFAPGECSGALCSTIGGSQAPQNQPRKSLFPEGQCGGVLCSAIGGSQAPQHSEPPPPCAGGLLCDMAPYALGQPFITPEEAARRQAAAAPPPAVPEPRKVKAAHRKKTMAKRTPAPPAGT